MNFEELLDTRDARKTTKVRLPYGFFYRRLIDGRYSNFVEFHDELTADVFFDSCIKKECEDVAKTTNRNQLHFTANEGEDGVFAIAVEVGNFISIEQLVNDNPSIVAKKDFINNTIRSLIELTEELNAKGVYHVCFSPNNVLIRKNDNAVKLLCHGSYYARLDQEQLYDGVEKFVAPEVISQSKIDERSDVYSLAKFIEWLYQSSGLPMELKSVLAKAVAENPGDRFANVVEFHEAIKSRRNLRRIGILAVSAVSIAMLFVWLFFYLLPSPDNIEFVQPVKEIVPEDMIDDDEVLLGIGADADSTLIAQYIKEQREIKDSVTVDEKKMRQYQSKAEAIFRKQFTRRADVILSNIYNNEKMNLSEKEFSVRSRAMTEQLAKLKDELSRQSGLTSEHAERIASEIVDQLTKKKMKELDESKKNN
ncbi:MAG: hypothetical protein IJ159_01535 [Prevotella sp.]|nr:hypothetical protein [Prevotella sp.]